MKNPDPINLNLPLLRKRLGYAEEQLAKWQERVDTLREQVQEGENAVIVSAVRGYSITPEALTELLREMYDKEAEEESDDVPNDPKEENDLENLATL